MVSSKILLTVDVGNTATNFAVFRAFPIESQPRPLAEWTISTKRLRNEHAFKILLFTKLIRKFPSSGWLGAVVASVVPDVNKQLGSVIYSGVGFKPHFVDGRSPIKVKVVYNRPREVGADRIVNARAVREFTAAPCIVVDFGTATTFDCINGKGEFLGGVIAPGPMISAEALYRRTAKLPLVILQKPARIMGRSTLECIQSGLFFGYRGLVKEIVFHLKTVMGPLTKVFSTGGQAHWILKGLGIIDLNIRHLTLMGLYHVWHDLAGTQQIPRRKK